MAGFNLPPGVSVSDLPGNQISYCDVCQLDTDHCICPTCSTCGEIGGIGCYKLVGGHGLKLSHQQIINRQESKVEDARQTLHDEEGNLMYIRGYPDYSDDPLGVV